MALSDGPILDAQAGAETFGSALIAALAGVNSVSGPGMLDFLLVFSLPKLVFDDEMCGQALRFVREVEPLDDLPVDDLVDQLMADQHLIMAAAHDRPLADRAVPAERDRRSRQPRGVDCRPGAQGHLPARLRRGRPAAGRLPPARDRPGDRRRAARGSSGPGWSTRTDRCPRSRSPPSRSLATGPGPANAATTAAAKPPPAQPARRIPRHDHADSPRRPPTPRRRSTSGRGTGARRSSRRPWRPAAAPTTSTTTCTCRATTPTRSRSTGRCSTT